MTTSNITTAHVAKFLRANQALISTAVNAKANSDQELARVNAYISPVFESFNFYNMDDGSRITNPDNLYLSSDEELAAEYYEACDKAHRDNGFTGSEGYCPALVAKDAYLTVETELVNAFLGLCGVQSGIRGDLRKEIVNTLLQGK